MKRAVPAVFITVLGLGALASFKSTSGLPAKSTAAVVVPRSTAPATTAPPPASQSKSLGAAPTTTTPTTSPKATPTTPKTTPKTTPTTAAQTRTILGDPVDNQYGTVQVQVSMQGNQILDVVAVQLPDSHQRSLEIGQQAEPLLRQEALQAQSAQINIVSGATFTSESYAQSLQSALNQ